MDELHLIRNKRYFDMPSFEGAEAGTVYDMLPRLPGPWKCTTFGIWRYYSPLGHELPDAGWKVHVSASQRDAPEILSCAAAIFGQRKVPFKHLRTRQVHVLSDGKAASRFSSGKFIAAYPSTSDNAVDLLDELEAALASYSGPYVVSDMRWGKGPVFTRYGSFKEAYVEDAAGELVLAVKISATRWRADSRAAFVLPADVEVPDAVRDRYALGREQAIADFPYQDVSVLGFSNSGGVYQARRTSDGVTVVLKEGRALAGLDLNGVDGASRIGREARVLSALRGIPGVPEIYREFTAWENRFIEIEYLDGPTLAKLQGSSYPLVYALSTAAERYGYRARMRALYEQVAGIVRAIHDRGYVLGDLHPRNVVIRRGTAYLIDFECACSLTDEQAPGFGHLGYVVPGLKGIARDQYALEAMRLELLAPMAALIARQPGKRDAVEAFIHTVYAGPQAQGQTDDGWAEIDLGHAPLSWQRLGESILGAATPERTDRLYPGDPRQFAEHPGGFAYGAGGVLWALSGTGLQLPDEHTEWLRKVCADTRSPRIGLYDGYGGAMLALAALGHDDEAAHLLAEMHRTARGAGWHGLSLGHGLAGACACATSAPSWPDEASFGELCQQFLADVRQELADAEKSGSRRHPGLEHGYAGIALALLHLADALDDETLRECATRAYRLDLHRLVQVRDGSLHSDYNNRHSPYASIGTAGVLLAGRELAGRGLIDIAELAPLILACGALFVIQPQFAFGRSGLLGALTGFGTSGGASITRRFIDRHRAMLALDALDAGNRIEFLGEQLARCSTDFMTGSAGVLRALAAADLEAMPVFPFCSSRSALVTPAPDRAVTELAQRYLPPERPGNG